MQSGLYLGEIYTWCGMHNPLHDYHDVVPCLHLHPRKWRKLIFLVLLHFGFKFTEIKRFALKRIGRCFGKEGSKL